MKSRHTGLYQDLKTHFRPQFSDSHSSWTHPALSLPCPPAPCMLFGKLLPFHCPVVLLCRWSWWCYISLKSSLGHLSSPVESVCRWDHQSHEWKAVCHKYEIIRKSIRDPHLFLVLVTLHGSNVFSFPWGYHVFHQMEWTTFIIA